MAIDIQTRQKKGAMCMRTDRLLAATGDHNQDGVASVAYAIAAPEPFPPWESDGHNKIHAYIY